MVVDTFLIVLIVRCFKKTVYFLFFHSYDFVTVSPLSSKTNNCYNIHLYVYLMYQYTFYLAKLKKTILLPSKFMFMSKRKIEKASEMQQPSCKTKSFGLVL
jgi:hypothetical protein